MNKQVHTEVYCIICNKPVELVDVVREGGYNYHKECLKNARLAFMYKGKMKETKNDWTSELLKVAQKELKKVGCARAKGDALRFMYANLLAFEFGLSSKANITEWPIPEIYKELKTVSDDKVYEKVQELRKTGL